MIVIGLCNHSLKALRIWNRLKDLELHLLVAKNPKSGIATFLLKEIFLYLIMMSFKDRILFFKLLFSGRLKISFHDVHHEKILSWLKSKKPDIGLHAIGVIYKKPLISLFRLGILNSHIGLLPQYRGRSVMEWSILNNSPTAISTLFIDEGVDTGKKILFIQKIDISKFKSIACAKKYLFSLDVKMFKKAISLLRQEEHQFIENNIKQGKRYYVMSGLLRDVVEKILKP